MKHPPDPATRISKRLSFILRHQPQSIGITLDAQGWADVAILLQQLNAHGTAIDRALLDHVVATNPKQRFSYDTSGTKIRANQGHSVAIDLAYTPCVPPETLYHGTARSTFAAILESGGLDKRTRHHVHLSSDVETAMKVGQRHGKPLVLRIAAGEMQRDGHVFYQSDNGVWLTEHVPLAYISADA